MRTDAQRRAQNKWAAANMSIVACKIKRDIAESFKAAAKANGTNPNALIHEWIVAYLEKQGAEE